MDGTIEHRLYRPDELADEAWAAMNRQDTDEALRLWQALRELSPESPEGHIWPIPLLCQSGRFDDAEAMVAQAPVQLRDHPELLVQHAWTAASQNRWEDAAARWAAVRTAAPDRLEGHVWGTHALWRFRQLDEAETVANEGIRRFPNDFQMRAEHGWVATARGDWAEAVRRWSLVNDAFPGRADAQSRLIQALRNAGRTEDADAMAANLLAERPNDTELLIEFVWTAMARDDWPAAAVRLEAAQSKAANPARVAESLGPVEPQIRTLATAPPGVAGPIAPIPMPSGARDEAAATLMLGFESIGERCDFGAVQRHFGTEPLGLLRFAWSKLDSLIAALGDRFDAVGTADDTSFERFGDETILWMKKYNLIFHTFVEGVEQKSAEQREAFYQQQRRRLSFLKDKLIRDLEAAEKIWIYATRDYAADADVAKLFAALRAYGPNALLYVRPERDDRPAGTVEALEDGLYAGYFPGLADFVRGQQPPFELWRQLCLKTYLLTREAPCS